MTDTAGGFVATEADRSSQIWTVAEAKARLSHILRCAEEEGPQRIGTRRTFVVVPEHVWQQRAEPDVHLGRWLVDNMPRGLDIELPDRSDDRPTPFVDYAVDDGDVQ